MIMNKKELYEVFVKETDQDIREYHDHKYSDWLEDYVLKLTKQLGLHAVSKSVICPNCEEDCQPIPLGHFCNKCYYDVGMV